MTQRQKLILILMLIIDSLFALIFSANSFASPDKLPRKEQIYTYTEGTYI